MSASATTRWSAGGEGREAAPLTSELRPVSTLHDYLGVLRRRKWIIIPAVLIAPLAAGLVSSLQPVRYEASAHVLVRPQSLSQSLTGVNNQSQPDAARLLSTQVQFARLPTIARRAAVVAGTETISASELLAASRATSADNSDFVTFTVSDGRSARAIQLVNAYAREYVSYVREIERSQFEYTQGSIQSRSEERARGGATGSPGNAIVQEEADRLATKEAVAVRPGSRMWPADSAVRVGSQAKRNAILAFLLGAIAGIGIAFVRNALDLRPRSAEDIGEHLGLRLLGRVPRPPRTLRGSKRLVTLADPGSPHALPFRTLRTRLELVAAQGSASGDDPLRPRSAQRGRRLMFTSAVDGEGKSTTVASLAVAFAQAGRKVFLVDLDFRNPSLHRLFGLPTQPGLTEAVHGQVPLDAAISHVELSPEQKAAGDPSGEPPGGTLGVVPLGLEVQGSDGPDTVALEEVLERLARDADLVLIDSPSLLERADAVALTAYADALVVVANPRALPIATLDEVRRVLDESPGSNVLGYVATGEALEKGHGRISAVRGRALQVGRFLASLTLRLRPGRLPLVSHGDSHR